MQPQQPVIRTYRGRDRRSAEEAYRLDAVAASRAAWFPVAHRWASSWAGDELSVVFEYRAELDLGYAAVPPQYPQPYPQHGFPDAPSGRAPSYEPPAPVYRQPPAYGQPPAYEDSSGYGAAGAYQPSPGYEPPIPEAALSAPPEWASTESESQVDGALDAAWGQPAEEAAGWDAGPAAEPEAGPGAEPNATPDAAPFETTFEPTTETEPASDSAWDAAGDTPSGGRIPPEPAEPAEWAEPAQPAEPVPFPAPFDPEPVVAAEPVVAPEPFLAVDAQPSEPARIGSTPAVRAHARAVVQAIDLHAAGEPLRLIRSGYPAVPSLPILERRRWLKENADYARRVLMFEPRGHSDMYGAILLPPYGDDADVAVLFMHNAGYSTMCGHGIIAIATALVEEGLYPASAPETVIRFETPAGVVSASVTVTRSDGDRNEVGSVRFRNVPSYLHVDGLRVRPDGVELHGRAAADDALSVQLAFGGAYYGIVEAADLGLRVVPAETNALARAGAAITEVLRRDHTPTHPTDADLGFVYGTIILDRDPRTSPDGKAGDADVRNVTIFADAEVDRSPCGSGTSALLAWLHATGQLKAGQPFTNAGITGEVFLARVESETMLGDHSAVITTVEGNAYVTGYHTFVVDDRDPLGPGFLLR